MSVTIFQPLSAQGLSKDPHGPALLRSGLSRPAGDRDNAGSGVYTTL